MIFTKEGAELWVGIKAGGRPIIRRDTTTTVVTLHKDEVMKLIAQLSHPLQDDGFNEIYLVIEGGEIYPQEVFDE